MRLQMKPWALLTRLQEPGKTDTLMLHDRQSLYMLWNGLCALDVMKRVGSQLLQWESTMKTDPATRTFSKW